MSHLWKIIELKDKLADGLVPHNVEFDGQILGTNMSYDSAREFVSLQMKPGEKLIEVYLSSGNQAEYSFDEFMDSLKVTENLLNRYNSL